MAYQSNIPLATDQLSISQNDIKNNFVALGTLLNPDSGGITFPLQTGAPAANTKLQMYSINNGAGLPALFIERETGSAYPSPVDFTTKFSNGNGNYCYLPSGVLIQWGTAPTNGGARSFPVAFTVACQSLTATGRTPTTPTDIIVVEANIVSMANYTLVSHFGATPNTTTVSWFAIGV